MNRAHVVYLIFPTSNRNITFVINHVAKLYILSFLHQTATHWNVSFHIFTLYILSFLHQTATIARDWVRGLRLYILSFLHQTATYLFHCNFLLSCISYLSYIKPQPCYYLIGRGTVVYLIFPTSNRNLSLSLQFFVELYILSFLHQTATSFAFFR